MLRQPNGVYAAAGLTATELTQIKELLQVCNKYDQIEIKLNLDMLNCRPTDQIQDFYFAKDNRIIGYLALYIFNSREVEISGMVDPAHRRNGIFSSLLRLAYPEIERRQLPKLIFMSQEKSASGKAFLEALGSTYSFSEYWMELEASPTEPIVPSLLLREATKDDLPLLVQIDMESFGLSKEDAKKYASTGVEEPDRHLIVAFHHNEFIGKISHQRSEDIDFIYGFAVMPALQGKGYGREILTRVVNKLIQEQSPSIVLEVETKNKNALKLYNRCGFKEVTANDYYILATSQLEGLFQLSYEELGDQETKM
ncbi:GNAT family N-acetyltransferase [Brevibacillus sp. VP]|uniref:GNAT family N-acetyltransferase n=1 Tax=unclassified Brevibacillus TaxID=2684853 RepID=UPI000E2E6C7E|nr:GNAT family N-acetyltransferase [Brevibacillus sp. VP]RFB37802.1 GNAT family N-acetyltransferase [Brevibacillus sp. VP]